MKTIPIIAQLRSTSGYDTDAPYVYLELDMELLARIEKAVSLYSRHQNDLSLGLSKLTIHGPSMTALVNLPALTEEQRETLNDDESILLDSPIPETELATLEATSGSAVKASTSLMPGAFMLSPATSTPVTCMRPISGPC